MRRLALLVLVLPLAACGGGSKHSSSSTPLDAVKTAAQKTYAAGTESLSLTANVQAAGEAVTVGGNGAFATKGARGSMSLHVDAGPIATAVDEVLVGTSVYLKSPLLAAGLPAGKTWLKLDLTKVHVSGLDLQSLLAQNPGQELKTLQSLKSAKKVGTGQVGGVSATHYTVQTTAATFPSYDVWVGDDGYIHRVQVAQANPKVSVTLDLSKFGEKVTATAPPASQVFVSKNGNIPGLGGTGA
ncbi:MAG TPA: hypothetical protein VGG88_12275 [Gaiellaceae bacterium]|jgi:hypothetical protein